MGCLRNDKEEREGGRGVVGSRLVFIGFVGDRVKGFYFYIYWYEKLRVWSRGIWRNLFGCVKNRLDLGGKRRSMEIG